MDPLTAFSLACGIVQFVDFSSKLVSKGYELSISAEGALAENLDLETVTTDLSRLADRLSQNEELTCFTEDQQELRDLASSCQTLADQLMDKLQKLKVDKAAKYRRWKSIRQALKTVWSKKDLDEMVAKLATFRSQLELRLLVSLKWVIHLPHYTRRILL